MKYIVRFAVMILAAPLLASAYGDSAERDPALVELPHRTATADTGDGLLSVSLDVPFAYIANQHDKEGIRGWDRDYYGIVNVVLVRNDIEEKSTEGYYAIKGRPHKLSLASGDQRVFELDASHLIVKSVGTADVVVRLADSEVRMPFSVFRFPLNEFASIDKAVQVMGLPDWKQETYVLRSDSGEYDGIYYSSSKSVKHWRFSNYPGAVMVIGHEDIRDMRMSRWRLRDGLEAPVPNRVDLEKFEHAAKKELKEPNGKQPDPKERAAATQLKLAHTLIENSRKKDAKERLERLVREFPHTDAAKEAANLLKKLK